MNWFVRLIALLLFTVACARAESAAATNGWEPLAKGVEYRKLFLCPAPLGGTGELHVVRINPDVARLTLLTARGLKTSNRTARAWCSDFKLTVAINAGMYDMDHATHTGYLRTRESMNNPKWVKDYESILLLHPRSPNARSALLLDRSDVDSALLNSYDTAAQNLRLIKSNGTGVWAKQPRRWSEAAIATDAKSNLLFLFIRAPYSMHELNECLLASDLHIVRAAHLEGGPEASLSIQTPAKSLHLSGSHETGFNENDDNNLQWNLPNIIGVTTDP